MNAATDPAFSHGFALVAGGSGGIGSATCLALSQAGSEVVIGYRHNRAKAETLAHTIIEAGGRAEPMELRLDKPAALRKTLDELIDRRGELHSVVYAAGPAITMHRIADLHPDEWASTFASDVNGAFNLATAALPHLRNRGGGALVAVITAAVQRVPVEDILSAAPKAAIEMLMRGIAKEEGRHGIRANCVGPGWIDAGLGRQAMAEHLSPELTERLRKSIPLKRFGQADEVAQAVRFLLSSQAQYITGQTLCVDGGMQL